MAVEIVGDLSTKETFKAVLEKYQSYLVAHDAVKPNVAEMSPETEAALLENPPFGWTLFGCRVRRNVDIPIGQVVFYREAPPASQHTTTSVVTSSQYIPSSSSSSTWQFSGGSGVGGFNTGGLISPPTVTYSTNAYEEYTYVDEHGDEVIAYRVKGSEQKKKPAKRKKKEHDALVDVERVMDLS